MTAKIKVISICLAFVLIGALCVGLAYALPTESFNLNGSLSYTPQTKTYYELMPSGETTQRLVVNSNKFKLIEESFLKDYEGMLCYELYGTISGGRLNLEFCGNIYLKSQYSQNFLFTSSDQKMANSFDYRLPDPFEFSVVSGDYVIIAPGIMDGDPTIYIREDAPKGQLLYFGNPSLFGWDLKIPLQQENLTAQELINAFDKGGEDDMLVVVEADGTVGVDLSSLSFEPFDQTSPGKKQVEVTFTNPFTNLQTTQTITIYVYDQNAEETSFEISVSGAFLENGDITASSIAEKLTDALKRGGMILIHHADGTTEDLEQITADMISNIKINEEFNMVSCILTHSELRCILQLAILEEGESNNLFLSFGESLKDNIFLVEAGTTNYNRFVWMGYYDSTLNAFPLNDAEFKFTCGGSEMTLDEIYQTPGLKEIKVEVTLEDGREFVMFENFPIYVYDNEHKVPTSVSVTWGDKNPSDMDLLPDGSLDLSGCYLNVYYNSASASDQSLVLGQDYEQIPLSSDSVEVISFKLFDPGSSEPRTVITSIIYRVEVNGQEVAFVTGP